MATMSLPQMPDVAGQSKEAAEKAAKAAKEAADLAAAKTKETYDLLIPAQIDWFEPINLPLTLKGEPTRAAHLSQELRPHAVCQSVALYRRESAGLFLPTDSSEETGRGRTGLSR